MSCAPTAAADRPPCNSGRTRSRSRALSTPKRRPSSKSPKIGRLVCRATCAVAEGKPAAVILGQAELIGADLIVIGNLRMQGAKRVLGAVANDILHHAPCDVLCVKTV